MAKIKAIELRNKVELKANELAKKLPLQLQNAQNSFKTWTNENGKAFGKLGTEIGNLDSELTRISKMPVGVEQKKSLDQWSRSFTGLKKQAESFGVTGRTVFGEFGNMIKKFLGWLSAGTIIMQTVRAIKDMISSVTELDIALVELQKVTNLSQKELQSFTNQAMQVSEVVARTTTDIIKASSEFARMGFSASDSLNLAKQAAILVNIGDGINNIEEASSSIIATLKGFNLEASSTSEILDKLNEVSNNYAVDTSDLSIGISKVSASMAAAGNDLDETLALFTSATEVLRDADRASVALRTISMRLRGVNEDGEDLTSLVPELQKYFDAYGTGVKLIDDTTGAFNSTYDILLKLSDSWAGLNDLQRANLTELIAGKRQSDTLNAVMTNTDTLINVLTTSQNSYGSALKENSIYMDSIRAKTELFNKTAQDLWIHTINSDTIKTVVDLGTGILKLVDDVGLLNTVITIISGIVLSKYIPTILSATGVTNAFTVAIASAPPLLLALGSMAIIGGIIALVDVINNANESISDMYETLNENYNRVENNIAELQQLALAYEELAKKEDKSLDDKAELTNIQTILNTKYRDAFNNVNLYTDAINLNNNAIEENIRLIREQAKTEAESFVELNKLYYEQAKEYLDKDIYREIPNVGGITFENPEDALNELTNMINTAPTDAIRDTFQKWYDEIYDELSKAQDIVIEYESYVNRLKSLKISPEFQKAVSELISQNASQSVDDLKKSLIELGRQYDISDDALNQYVNDVIAAKEASNKLVESDNNLQRSLSDILTDSDFESQVKGWISTLEDFRIAVGSPEYDNAINSLADTIGIGAQDITSNLDLISAYANGNERAFQDALNAQLQLFGASGDPSGITGAISQIIKAANNGQTAAIKLAQILAAIGAVKISYKTVEIGSGGYSVQIPVFEGLGNLNFPSPSTSSSGSSGGGGGGGSSSDRTTKAFDKDLKKLKHKLAMQEITEAEYYDKLNKLNDKYFKGKRKYLDEYWKYEEEYYQWKIQHDLSRIDTRIDYNTSIRDTFDEGSKLWEQYNKRIYNLQSQKQAELTQQIQELLDAGFSKTSDEVLDLQQQWYEIEQWKREEAERTAELQLDSIRDQISLYETMRDVTEEGSSQWSYLTKQIAKQNQKLQDEILKQIQETIAEGDAASSDSLNELYQEWYELEQQKREEQIKTLEIEQDRMEQAHSAVIRHLDEEIEKINKQKDALSDEDIKGSYGYRIKAIQDVIDGLQKQNEETQLANDLEKARQELEDARIQKTKYVYDKDNGFIYTSDAEAISEAEQNLADLELEKTISDLEDQKSELEKSLEEEEKAFDSQIDVLTEYKNQWDDILDSYQNSQDDLIAAQVLGADWESKILDGRVGTLNKFKNKYNRIQKQISDISQQGIPELTELFSNNGLYFLPSNPSIPHHASGRLGGSAGLAIVDEYGKEMRIKAPISGKFTVLGDGESVYPADRTKNLWDWGAFNPNNFASQIVGIGTGSLFNGLVNKKNAPIGKTYQFGSVQAVFPNVHVANEIIDAFSELENHFKQKSFD